MIFGRLGRWPGLVCMGTRNIPWTTLEMCSRENLCYSSSEGEGRALKYWDHTKVSMTQKHSDGTKRSFTDDVTSLPVWYVGLEHHPSVP